MKAGAALAEYRRKRRPGETPEPLRRHAGLELVPPPRRAGHRFCIQEHHATRLHYDLRLEMDGVLRSWAVPKGPTLDPEVRRLAMATEDHPLEYLTFEGEIPAGNYGAGEVIVWDLGDYEPVGDVPPVQQWERGHLKFMLHGKKLRGEFALTRMASRRDAEARLVAEEDPQEKQDAWLLIKKHDAAQRFGDSADRHPGSVLSRRPRRAATSPGPRLAQPAKPARQPSPAQRRAMPRLQPMLARLGNQPFSDPAWLFEIKWDGIRALAHCHHHQVTLISRTSRDLSAQYPELAHWPGVADAVLDGEIVALDAAGVSSFHRLQQRMNLTGAGDIARAATAIPVQFYAFDLLWLKGRDLTRRPLWERKQRLAELPWSPPWRYSDHVVGDGIGFFEVARARGLEGMVAKRADSPYEAGRSRAWIKFKLARSQEVVVVGYTDPQGSRTAFGALLVANFDPAQDAFHYAGRVGTGFDAATRRNILARLQPTSPPTVADGGGRGVHWVKPELVAEVKFAEWTPAGHLRAPVFLGLRADKLPRDCVREVAAA
jgi:bifunctional non-homologous end joining protein LigD